MNDFKLDNEPKISSGFSTPDAYFDTLSEKILTQLSKEEPKTISIARPKKTWYYAAAAIIVLALSIPIYNNYHLNQDEIDSATLENYIAYHSGVTEDQIVDLLEQEDLDKMNLKLEVDESAIEEALKTNTNLEEYIID
ncbi:hypothetical protein [Flavobacterium sp.]